MFIFAVDDFLFQYWYYW